MPLEFEKIGNFEIDENGFMRVKARFLAAGTMQYAKHELGDFALPADPEGKIYDIFVGMDTISDPRAIRSLEGMPVVSDVHTWIDSDNTEVAVGSVAGTPQINGPFLEGEIVITDSETIKAIQAGTLCDISAAYNSRYIMGQGEHDGNFYDGKQTEIRYNHIALLSPGSGRGGREVRVLNTKKEIKMPDFTAVQLGDSGQTVRVLNEDVAALNNFTDGARKIKTKNMEHEVSLEETMNAFDEKKAQVEALNGEMEEMKGNMAVMKERLDNALDPATVEETANNIVQERDEAKKLIENMPVDEKEKEGAMNAASKLSGHALRLFCVNKVRTCNEKEDLSKEDSEKEDFVRGQYNAYKNMPQAANKRVVNGAGVAAQVQNSGAGDTRQTGTRALGYPKQEA